MDKFCIIGVLTMSTVVMIDCRSWTTNRTLPETECMIYPKGSGQPCVQYKLKDHECSTINLKSQFPDLFNISEGDSWPAAGIKGSMCNTTISWGTRKDGNYQFLRGFLVNFIGNDMMTRGMLQCVVIDLSKLSKDMTDDLIHSTFEVESQIPGDFQVDIKSLPLPPPDFEVAVGSINASCERKREYHPQTSMSIETTRMFGSSIVVCTHFVPALLNFGQLDISVYNCSNNQPILQRSVQMGCFDLQNLTDGNYTLQVTPIEPYPYDNEKCLCYTALAGTRERCQPCRAYLAVCNVTVKERSSLTSFNPPERKWILRIVMPVLGVVIVIGFVSGFVVWWTRRNKHGFQLRYFFKYHAGCSICSRRRAMHLIYTADNSLHTRVISAFTDMMTSLGCVDVIHGRNDCVTKYSLDDESALTDMQTVDIICVVHSESSYRLYKGMQNGDITIGELNSKEDIWFAKCMQALRNSKQLYEKTIALHIPISSERFTIEDHDEHTFPTVEDIDEFLQYAQMKTKLKRKTTSKIELQEKIIALEGALATYRKYYTEQNIKRNDTRLDKKENMTENMKETKTPQTSKESSSCLQTVNNGNDSAFNDGNNEKRKPRDFSFFSPEPSLDAMSTEFSVLEGVVFDINSRYEQLMLDDDCLTIGGQSV